MGCSCEFFTNIQQQQLYKSPIWFWYKKINNIRGLNILFGEVKDWESLSLLQTAYMAPIATDPGTGTHFAPQILSHCLWSPVAQAVLVVSHQGEAAAPERQKSKAFLLQTEWGPSVSEPLANFWTPLYEFILHMAAIASTIQPRKNAFKASCAALSVLQNFTVQLRHRHPAVITCI